MDFTDKNLADPVKNIEVLKSISSSFLNQNYP